ncbi:MAG: hypothetical protein H0U76_01955, partial [Ktedonobacteraceae bacterium]|nr:hypothetical protein [Ktedonobacteraceae bacterium]
MRPTGTPTPPWLRDLLCHALAGLSSEGAHPLHIYFGEGSHHQLGRAQAWQVALSGHGDTAHAGGVRGLHACYRVLD